VGKKNKKVTGTGRQSPGGHGEFQPNDGSKNRTVKQGERGGRSGSGQKGMRRGGS